MSNLNVQAGAIRPQIVMKQKEFKALMPDSAAFIESLCKAFGVDLIHGQIRDGLAGAPTFHAFENGHEIGTPFLTNTGITTHPKTGSKIDVHALELERQGAELLDPAHEMAVELRGGVCKIDSLYPNPSYVIQMNLAERRKSDRQMAPISRMPKDEKAKFLARFVDVFLIEEGNRYVVGSGDKRTGLRGQHIATIGLKHDPGYEIILKLDNGKIDSFRPGNLYLEQFHPPAAK